MATKESFESIVPAALQLLCDLDPYGLMPGARDGAPANEYDLEADSIAECLLANRQITAAQVDVIWVKWFSEPLSGVVGQERVEQLAQDLNRAD